jgi:hypothetical protein
VHLITECRPPMELGVTTFDGGIRGLLRARAYCHPVSLLWTGSKKEGACGRHQLERGGESVCDRQCGGRC